jgi:hypothetical protein
MKKHKVVLRYESDVKTISYIGQYKQGLEFEIEGISVSVETHFEVEHDFEKGTKQDRFLFYTVQFDDQNLTRYQKNRIQYILNFVFSKGKIKVAQNIDYEYAVGGI